METPINPEDLIKIFERGLSGPLNRTNVSRNTSNIKRIISSPMAGPLNQAMYRITESDLGPQPMPFPLTVGLSEKDPMGPPMPAREEWEERPEWATPREMYSRPITSAPYIRDEIGARARTVEEAYNLIPNMDAEPGDISDKLEAEAYTKLSNESVYWDVINFIRNEREFAESERLQEIQDLELEWAQKAEEAELAGYVADFNDWYAMDNSSDIIDFARNNAVISESLQAAAVYDDSIPEVLESLVEASPDETRTFIENVVNNYHGEMPEEVPWNTGIPSLPNLPSSHIPTPRETRAVASEMFRVIRNQQTNDSMMRSLPFGNTLAWVAAQEENVMELLEKTYEWEVALEEEREKADINRMIRVNAVENFRKDLDASALTDIDILREGMIGWHYLDQQWKEEGISPQERQARLGELMKRFVMAGNSVRDRAVAEVKGSDEYEEIEKEILATIQTDIARRKAEYKVEREAAIEKDPELEDQYPEWRDPTDKELQEMIDAELLRSPAVQAQLQYYGMEVLQNPINPDDDDYDKYNSWGYVDEEIYRQIGEFERLQRHQAVIEDPGAQRDYYITSLASKFMGRDFGSVHEVLEFLHNLPDTMSGQQKALLYSVGAQIFNGANGIVSKSSGNSNSLATTLHLRDNNPGGTAGIERPISETGFGFMSPSIITGLFNRDPSAIAINNRNYADWSEALHRHNPELPADFVYNVWPAEPQQDGLMIPTGSFELVSSEPLIGTAGSEEFGPNGLPISSFYDARTTRAILRASMDIHRATPVEGVNPALQTVGNWILNTFRAASEREAGRIGEITGLQEGSQELADAEVQWANAIVMNMAVIADIMYQMEKDPGFRNALTAQLEVGDDLWGHMQIYSQWWVNQMKTSTYRNPDEIIGAIMSGAISPDDAILAMGDVDERLSSLITAIMEGQTTGHLSGSTAGEAHVDHMNAIMTHGAMSWARMGGGDGGNASSKSHTAKMYRWQGSNATVEEFYNCDPGELGARNRPWCLDRSPTRGQSYILGVGHLNSLQLYIPDDPTGEKNLWNYLIADDTYGFEIPQDLKDWVADGPTNVTGAYNNAKYEPEFDDTDSTKRINMHAPEFTATRTRHAINIVLLKIFASGSSADYTRSAYQALYWDLSQQAVDMQEPGILYPGSPAGDPQYIRDVWIDTKELLDLAKKTRPRPKPQQSSGIYEGRAPGSTYVDSGLPSEAIEYNERLASGHNPRHGGSGMPFPFNAITLAAMGSMQEDYQPGDENYGQDERPSDWSPEGIRTETTTPKPGVDGVWHWRDPRTDVTIPIHRPDELTSSFAVVDDEGYGVDTSTRLMYAIRNEEIAGLDEYIPISRTGTHDPEADRANWFFRWNPMVNTLIPTNPVLDSMGNKIEREPGEWNLDDYRTEYGLHLQTFYNENPQIIRTMLRDNLMIGGTRENAGLVLDDNRINYYRTYDSLREHLQISEEAWNRAVKSIVEDLILRLQETTTANVRHSTLATLAYYSRPPSGPIEELILDEKEKPGLYRAGDITTYFQTADSMPSLGEIHLSVLKTLVSARINGTGLQDMNGDEIEEFSKARKLGDRVPLNLLYFVESLTKEYVDGNIKGFDRWPQRWSNIKPRTYSYSRGDSREMPMPVGSMVFTIQADTGGGYGEITLPWSFHEGYFYGVHSNYPRNNLKRNNHKMDVSRATMKIVPVMPTTYH